MGLLDLFQGQRDEFDNAHHANITHTLLASAASYEIAKAYEDHCAKNGKPDSHAKAKEIIAALGGGVFDSLIETKGLDAWDAHKRKKALEQAQENVSEIIVTDYQ